MSRFEYTFDANGNHTRQVESRGTSGGEETTYGYDDSDRLVAVAYPSETHLYQLDAVGNRTAEKRALAGVVSSLTVGGHADPQKFGPSIAQA